MRSALEAYLRESGEFTYTLQMDVIDRKLDPVEDFLVNRKAGHCEYFASALALLLRSVGIRSRVVNGFKGGDWNDLTKDLNVRQKHAHSWVEAYVGHSKSPDTLPLWVTLDPTPIACARNRLPESAVWPETSGRSPIRCAISGSSTSSATMETGKTN